MAAVNLSKLAVICAVDKPSDKVRRIIETMPIPCAHCAASMPDTASFCPGCGRDMHPAERARGRVGIFPEPIAGALAYFVLPAAAFLLIAPYRTNRFLRFHSFQCLALCLVALIGGATLTLMGYLLFFIPAVGRLFSLLVSMVVILGFLVIWIVLIVKALQGEQFHLPFVGDFAVRKSAEV